MLFKGAVEAAFGRRINRFLSTAILGDKEVNCFFPNPGRLKELLIPGTQVLLIPRPNKGRKTLYDMAVIRHRLTWVSIDSRVPNVLLKEALMRKRIPQFRAYSKIIAEYSFERSRVDFLLENDERCLLEVKSCTLVNDGIALLPRRSHCEGKEASRGFNHGEEKGLSFLHGFRSPEKRRESIRT